MKQIMLFWASLIAAAIVHAQVVTTNLNYVGNDGIKNQYSLATDFSCQQGTLTYIINRNPALPSAFTVSLYIDNPPYGVLSGNDVLFPQSPVNYTNTGNNIRGYFNNITSGYLILVIDAPGDRYDVVRAVGCAADTYAAFPSSLQSFEIWRNSAMVQVAWETMKDQNGRGFDVQRRLPGEDWTTVAYVATPTTTSADSRFVHYLYEDRNFHSGNAEYRLRQTDALGRTVYSDIKSVPGMDRLGGLVVYPNPSTDGNVNILFNDINNLRDVQLIDMSGRVVQQWRSVNNNVQQINNLFPGEYVVRVIDQQSGTVATQKLIVNRQ